MTVFKTLFFFLFLVSMVNAVSLVNSNQLYNVQSNLQAQIDTKPNYQTVTGIVTEAIITIPVPVETDPVWTADKPSYVTTTALEQAIALIPVPVIPSYDNSKIISVDSNHFVSVDTATNLLMYEVVTVIEPDTANLIFTFDWISTAIGEVHQPWANPSTFNDITYVPNGDWLIRGTGENGNYSISMEFTDGSMWSGYGTPPFDLTAGNSGEYGSVHISYPVISEVQTNCFKIYASVQELSQAVEAIGISTNNLQEQITALHSATNGMVTSVEITRIKSLTQAEYDALTPKISTTLYLTR